MARGNTLKKEPKTKTKKKWETLARSNEQPDKPMLEFALDTF